MGARLAEGLAHAHDRGILHRDMKPANILLTDDGRPMLLDFNLAEDLKRRASGVATDAGPIGGTLPYMAPEHLEAFLGGSRPVDARSDLFAFGVIFYEMLTGRPAFPIRDGLRPETLSLMISDRLGSPPLLRPWNPAVSPAVESIIRRCLEPNPEGRYQSARDLREDLERHLAHQPLRHAADPSRRERVGKWLRRHQRLAVATAVVALLGGIVGGFSIALGAHSKRVNQFEAAVVVERFRRDAIDAQNQLTFAPAEFSDSAMHLEHANQLDDGLAGARRTLKLVGIENLEPATWWVHPPVGLLDVTDREKVRREAGDLLLRVAWTTRGRALAATAADGRAAGLRDALAANRCAELCYPPPAPPRAVWSQRAALLTLVGDSAGAKSCEARARDTPPSLHDFARLGEEQAANGSFTEALVSFSEAIHLDPRNYRIWLETGVCHERLGEDALAESCFSTCIALRPDYAPGWYDRGSVALKQGKPGQAAHDLDQAIRLRPGSPDPVINRAIADQLLGRPDLAVEGFTRAMSMGTNSTRLFFMRSLARAAAGDAQGAVLDRAEGLHRDPTDPLSGVVRAKYREDDHDHYGALADLDRALASNPHLYPALRNKAALLASSFADLEGSISVLDRLLEVYPRDVESRAARGVLYARLGDRTKAAADAAKALEGNPRPAIYYQVAGIFARFAISDPDDRGEALRLLEIALRGGFGHDLIESDPDLDPVRDDPRFAHMLAIARDPASRSARFTSSDQAAERTATSSTKTPRHDRAPGTTQSRSTP
jgi:tetratricopeptide (TPR) repeat protein